MPDLVPVLIDTPRVPFQTGTQPGVEVKPLFEGRTERVRVERWASGASVSGDCPGGLEILVLEGSVMDAESECEKHAWIRLPAGARFDARSPEGCLLWVKSGHLAGY